MADFSMPIPAWLNRDYNPAETFLSAVKTGAAIGETQQRLAEEQRQADLKAQLERESMQNNLLKAQAELAVQQAYRSQQTDLEQQRLEEEKAYHTDLAQKSARDFMAEQEQRTIQNQLNEERLNRPISIGGVGYQRNPDTGKYDQVTEPQETGKSTERFTQEQELRAALQKVRDTEKDLRAFKTTKNEEADKQELAILDRNYGNAQANYYFLKRQMTPDSPEWSGGGTSTKSGLRYKIESVDDSEEE